VIVITEMTVELYFKRHLLAKISVSISAKFEFNSVKILLKKAAAAVLVVLEDNLNNKVLKV